MNQTKKCSVEEQSDEMRSPVWVTRVPRACGHFGQRMVTWRDSGIIKKYFHKIAITSYKNFSNKLGIQSTFRNSL